MLTRRIGALQLVHLGALPSVSSDRVVFMGLSVRREAQEKIQPQLY
jgi:hypothetical protein